MIPPIPDDAFPQNGTEWQPPAYHELLLQRWVEVNLEIGKGRDWDA